MPLVLLILIASVSLLGNALPLALQSTFYAISLTIKSLILFLLPIIISGLIFNTAIQISHNTTKWILGLILLVFCSNFFSTFLSHYVGSFVYHFDSKTRLPEISSHLVPRWTFEILPFVSNDKALLSGLVAGILMGRCYPSKVDILAHQLKKIVSFLLSWTTYLIPLFVIGFIIKLQSDRVMTIILKDYTLIFGIIVIAQYGYILAWYFIASRGSQKEFALSIKNMLPAAITGLSTMSSAAAMPLTILGTEKNSRKPQLAQAIITSTVNIHLIGDCFAIPILAYAVMKSYGMSEPSLSTYLVFSLYFVLAKFSVAAIPGGGILVMLPILQTYFSFHAEMLSLITALYTLLDPVITCANILGNGAFAINIDRFLANQKLTSH
ncbi:hypothetical protein BCY86_00210 [Pajaroellobacter abortibovis]|uniref:Transporter n=2 Tax=Pajaroellobacter abortibovis TaxID=1882918 RepID=A0A1L6MUT9_9BACT|nr:hypothetical protein BCY86_00210 [Pajaroellobacter abortibovis]